MMSSLKSDYFNYKIIPADDKNGSLLMAVMQHPAQEDGLRIIVMQQDNMETFYKGTLNEEICNDNWEEDIGVDMKQHYLTCFEAFKESVDEDGKYRFTLDKNQLKMYKNDEFLVQYIALPLVLYESSKEVLGDMIKNLFIKNIYLAGENANLKTKNSKLEYSLGKAIAKADILAHRLSKRVSEVTCKAHELVATKKARIAEIEAQSIPEEDEEEVNAANGD